MIYEVNIPHHYLWMTEGMTNRKDKFARYVEGYLKHSYPELKLVDIKGMKAICERREKR